MSCRERGKNNDENTKPEVTQKVESKTESQKPEPQKSESQQTNEPSQPLISKTNLAKRTNQILTVIASGIHAHISFGQSMAIRGGNP